MRVPRQRSVRRSSNGCRRRLAGFTLIEVLVVISIMVLLIGLLLPALARARVAARVTEGLSNLRQISIGMTLYHTASNGHFPAHSSSSVGPWGMYQNRPRWPDYLFPFVQNTEVFLDPLLSPRELSASFQKTFAHDPSSGYGGYGFNYQYLGNSRFNPAFHARDVDIRVASETVIIGSTAGSRGGAALNQPGDGAEGVYVLDPPLASLRRAHPDGRAYYPGDSVEEPDGTPQTYLWRSFPAERQETDPAFIFADGHAETLPLSKIDDHNGDGIKDNGYWNGRAEAAP
jgi:prepilin-type N-terminal cleavage/methylation domain-containing protein